MSDEKPSKVFDKQLAAVVVCVLIGLFIIAAAANSEVNRPRITNIRILHVTKFNKEDNVIFCVAQLIDKGRIIHDIVLYDLDLASIEVDETYQVLYRPNRGTYHWTVLTIEWKRNLQ